MPITNYININGSAAADGAIPIGSTANGYATWGTLTPGTNVNITNGSHSITIDASGGGTVATSFPTDSGTATPSAGALTVHGTGTISTSGAGSTVTITDTAANTIVTSSGTATASSNSFTIVGSTGISTSAAGHTVTVTGTASPPSLCNFFAYAIPDVANQTGDATPVNVTFGTVLKNVGGAYDGTSKFTAPNTGLYAFSYALWTANYTAAFDNYRVVFNGSAAAPYVNQFNPGVDFDNLNQVITNGSCIVPMTAGDTMQLQVIVGTSTKTITIKGQTTLSAGDYPTYFAGYQIA